MTSERATMLVPDSLYIVALVLPSISDTSLSFMLDGVKLAELSNDNFEGKNVTF